MIAPAPTPTHGPTVLMYSPDSIGLGHMRRHSAIASQLSRKVPDLSTVMLVGSAAGSFFELPPGADCIKLPSVDKLSRKSWKPRSLRMPQDLVRDLRAGLIQQSVEILRPDIFLVDHVPAGIWGELIPTLELIRTLPTPPRVILGLRDILDTPEKVTQAWEKDGIYELIEAYYDEILIYGSGEIFPTASAYGLEERFSGKIHYCGYICSDKKCGSPQESRMHLGVSGRRFIVVTAGGGHDAYPMMASTLDALHAVDLGDDVEVAMITGPLMPPKQRAELERAAQGLPVSIIPYTNDVQNYLNAADLVITMGGYNTLMETVRLSKLTIVVPRSGPSSEQTMRARIFDDLGLVRCIDPMGPVSRDLAREIKSALCESGGTGLSLAFRGINTAAQHLTRHISAGTNVRPMPYKREADSRLVGGSIG